MKRVTDIDRETDRAREIEREMERDRDRKRIKGTKEEETSDVWSEMCDVSAEEKICNSLLYKYSNS